MDRNWKTRRARAQAKKTPTRWPCGVCRNTKCPVVAACLTCRTLLCEGCRVRHDNTDTSPGHLTVEVSPATVPDLMCSDHKDQLAEVYCMDCRRPVCTACRILHTHSVQSFCFKESQGDSELDRRREELRGALSHLDDVYSGYYGRMMKTFDAVAKQKDRLLEQINTEAKRLVETLNGHLMQTGEFVRSMKSKIFHSMKGLDLIESIGDPVSQCPQLSLNYNLEIEKEDLAVVDLPHYDFVPEHLCSIGNLSEHGHVRNSYSVIPVDDYLSTASSEPEQSRESTPEANHEYANVQPLRPSREPSGSDSESLLRPRGSVDARPREGTYIFPEDITTLLAPPESKLLWERTFPDEGWITRICFLPEGNLVALFDNDQIIQFDLSLKTDQEFLLEDSPETICAWRPDSKLGLLSKGDTNKYTVTLSDGVKEDQFGPLDHCPGCPVAMAFTSGGDLVLCTRQPNTLLCYPAAGSLPPTWRGHLAYEPQYLTTDSTDRVITTGGRHVWIYDARGKELACLGGGGGGSGTYLRRPAGVCTDLHDNILVADYDSRHIVCYSRTGELRRLVAQVLDRPGDIAVLGTSHLAVATDEKTLLVYDYSALQESSEA